MKRVYKYQLNFKSNQGIILPRSAKILHVDMQFEGVYFWAEVDTEEVSIYRYFNIFGTGHNIPEEEEAREYVHVGTVKQNDSLIWHIYEMLEI